MAVLFKTLFVLLLATALEHPSRHLNKKKNLPWMVQIVAFLFSQPSTIFLAQNQIKPSSQVTPSVQHGDSSIMFCVSICRKDQKACSHQGKRQIHKHPSAESVLVSQTSAFRPRFTSLQERTIHKYDEFSILQH